MEMKQSYRIVRQLQCLLFSFCAISLSSWNICLATVITERHCLLFHTSRYYLLIFIIIDIRPHLLSQPWLPLPRLSLVRFSTSSHLLRLNIFHPGKQLRNRRKHSRKQLRHRHRRRRRKMIYRLLRGPEDHQRPQAKYLSRKRNWI
jgi:hypothetical protein